MNDKMTWRWGILQTMDIFLCNVMNSDQLWNEFSVAVKNSLMKWKIIPWW